jgi:2-succinyl-6-hydroxy-2,4-cyclohexadiene-1-carboxylate synthase
VPAVLPATFLRAHAPGPWLVALHGFLGQPESWAEAASAWPGPVALTRLPGHGLAPWKPEGRHFLDLADAVVDALPSPHPVWLAGYSMGGRLALAIALRHSARVAGALLVGAQPGLADEADRRARVAWEDGLGALALRDGLPALVDAWEKLPLFATQASLAPERLAAQRAARLAHTAPGVAWSLDVLGLGRMPPLWGELARTRVRLRFVAGSEDAKFRDLAARAASVAPVAQVVVVEGVGHNVVLEAPAAIARELAVLSSC